MSTLLRMTDPRAARVSCADQRRKKANISSYNVVQATLEPHQHRCWPVIATSSTLGSNIRINADLSVPWHHLCPIMFTVLTDISAVGYQTVHPSCIGLALYSLTSLLNSDRFRRKLTETWPVRTCCRQFWIQPNVLFSMIRIRSCCRTVYFFCSKTLFSTFSSIRNQLWWV